MASQKDKTCTYIVIYCTGLFYISVSYQNVCKILQKLNYSMDSIWILKINFPGDFNYLSVNPFGLKKVAL